MRLLVISALFPLLAAPLFPQEGHPVPAMVPIPPGPFLMGTAGGASWEAPVHKVQLSAYSISARPVSGRQFQAFRPAHPVPDQDADLPVTNLTWQDALEYAQWLTEKTGQFFRLPTEAEWEKAARGGLEQKKYPWGDEPPVPAAEDDNPDFQPESRPNAYGFLLGAGQSWEWTSDWYQADYYRSSPPSDPKGPAEGIYKVLRGGGYPDDPNSVQCANRGSARPSAASDTITFRIVSSAGSPVEITEVPASPPAEVPASAPAAVPASPPADVGEASVTLMSAVVDSSGGSAVLELTTSAQPSYNHFWLESPVRLVIDLSGARLGASVPYSIPVGRHGVRRVRLAQFSDQPPIARVVVDLAGQLDASFDATQRGLQVKLQLLP